MSSHASALLAASPRGRSCRVGGRAHTASRTGSAGCSEHLIQHQRRRQPHPQLDADVTSGALAEWCRRARRLYAITYPCECKQVEQLMAGVRDRVVQMSGPPQCFIVGSTSPSAGRQHASTGTGSSPSCACPWQAAQPRAAPGAAWQ